MNTKLVALGIALLISGVVLLGLTVYQELVEEPKPEDYHMGIPTERYEWRSRNPTITSIGVCFVVFGLGLITGGLLWKKPAE